MIPAQAVEAAAKAHFERDGGRWDDWTQEDKAVEMEDMRAALEAAAPHLMAEAFEQGQKSGMRHADRLVAAAKIGKPELPGPISLNPYRTPDAV